MSWIPFAIIASFFWAISNFVDKYSLSKYGRGPYDFMFFCSLTSWVFFGATFIFVGVPVLTWYSLLPVITGLLLTFSYGTYSKALHVAETSTLVLLFNLIPVGVLILSYLFMGQTLTAHELIAFIIILAGSMTISLERVEKKFKLLNGLGLILVSVVMWAVIFTVSDYALMKMSFWDFFLLDTLGAALAGCGFFIFPNMRREVVEGIRSATPGKCRAFLINGLFDFLAQMTSKYALALAASAALIDIVLQTQTFFSIAIAIFLTLFFPHIIKEDISYKTLSKKLLGAVVMFGGICLLLV